MAGLPWCELDVEFSEHPKVVVLQGRLREPLADAYVVRLWAYCYRYCTDRFSGDLAVDAVEAAGRWRGKRGVLADALLAARLIDRDGPDLLVHGVGERLAPHLAKRAKDAERQRERRANAAGKIGDLAHLRGGKR